MSLFILRERYNLNTSWTFKVQTFSKWISLIVSELAITVLFNARRSEQNVLLLLFLFLPKQCHIIHFTFYSGWGSKLPWGQTFKTILYNTRKYMKLSFFFQMKWFIFFYTFKPTFEKKTPALNTFIITFTRGMYE